MSMYLIIKSLIMKKMDFSFQQKVKRERELFILNSVRNICKFRNQTYKVSV